MALTRAKSMSPASLCMINTAINVIPITLKPAPAHPTSIFHTKRTSRRRALCAPQSNINSGQPCSFTEVPNDLPDLKYEWPPGPRKEPRCTFLFSQKSRQTNPLRFPNRAPMKREARLQGILHISQKPHLSSSPVKEPFP